MSLIKKRSLAFFIATLFVLAFLFIAVYGFGFKPKGEPIWNLGDLGSMTKIYDEMGEKFVGISYRLMVTAISISGIPIIMSLMLMVFINVTKINLEERYRLYFWLIWTIIGLVMVTIILMFSGELNFMIKMANYKEGIMNNNSNFVNYWNGGYFAGLIIFTLLPATIIFIPFAFKKKNKK
ncbi:hypothetical protein JN01_0279 [Entomoplasma freundtii]|uniref:Uncharacterized protein n=1 Tax=Entomoplasma freundtii TaxID=74700 RepID=A0A2K8NR93_9MOLU|nr:hypothetical protein [Entomoplasma freundtii]ATZ16307.1 hypothetical protein EFREU_v1c02810 [Entomoplasma freundtii]TDY56791.1 hypothetical protein JN01_0279 [Entomoplasma freundtii]